MASKLRNVSNKKSEEDLNSSNSYRLSEITRYGFPYMPMCMCYDPLQSLLAIGTKTGCIRVLGRPGVDVLLQHEEDVAVIGLQFIINKGQLISATSDDHIHLWNLRGKRPAVVHSLKFQRDRITCLHMPFQSAWLYVGTDKGNVFMVNATTFQLSGYNIMWNKTMDLHQKHHPGYVTQIVENPSDETKMLIGYEAGLIVLWDLNKKSAEFHYKTCDVKYVSWHHEGKLFMSCHRDGRLSVWNAKSPLAPEKSWVPHLKETDGKEESCHPIKKVEWKSSKSSDSIIIFSGGLSADRGSTPSMTLTFSGEEVVTFKLDSPVVDFLTICSTPFGNAVQDPVAVVVLMREEFVVVDLTNQSFLPFEPAYPFDIHESKVTSCCYVTNCSPDIVPMLYSITSKQKRRKFTDKEWPIKGGQWGSPVFSYSELIITGHEDGSIKFWDATGVTLLMLYKIKTARLFEPDSANSPVGGATPTQPRTPPTFHLKSENPNPYAVHHLSFCDESKLLCAGGSYHLILYKFNKTETSSECPVIDIHMVYQNFDSQPVVKSDESGASSPEDEKQSRHHVQVRQGIRNWPPGYKAEFCCSVVQDFGKQSSSVVSVALNSKYGLLAVGNETGMAVIDILRKTCLFAFACPDLYGSSDPFSRSPPPLATNSTADQSEDKKVNTPLSSISTENPNTLLNPTKTQEDDVDKGPPQTPSTPQTPMIPSNASSRKNSAEDSAPVAPPRRKKKAVGVLQETEADRKDCGPELPPLPISSPKSSAIRAQPPLVHGSDENQKNEKTDDLELAEEAISLDKNRIKYSKGSNGQQAIQEEGAIEEVVEQKNAEVQRTGQVEEKKGEQNTESIQTANTCENHKICSCLQLSNDVGSRENDSSKICCCLAKTDRVPSGPEESKLLPRGPSSCHSPKSKFPTRDSTCDRKMTEASNAEKREDSGVRAAPTGRQGSVVSPPSILPAEAAPSWKVKFNRFRSTFLHAITALTATPPPKSDRTEAKFEVVDLSEDVVSVTKETSYSEYVAKCRGDILAVREGSTSDEENIKESVLQFVFMESFPRKNEATFIPCIWVATSLGSVLVLSAETSPGNQNPVVAPTGTIFRLKGSIVDVSFLDSSCSLVLKSPAVAWKNFGQRECTEKKPSEGVSASEIMQHVILTSNKQIRLIGLPSMTCLQKFKVVDDNFIVKAKAVSIKDSLRLLTRHVNGNVTVFELPSLKVIGDFNYVAGKHPRLSKTFQFSNFGQGIVMVFPTEIQKFAINEGNDDQSPDVDRQLFTLCEVPEPPKVGFFQSFFDNQQQVNKLNREALFGESGSGKPSKSLTTYVNKTEKLQVAAADGSSEIAQAKMAALERGEKLGELEEKTDRMRMNAESFGQMATQIKNKYKNKKWYQF